MTLLTNESVNDEDTLTVYNVLDTIGLYGNRPISEGNISARTKDVTDRLQRALGKIGIPPPPLPAHQNEESEKHLMTYKAKE